MEQPIDLGRLNLPELAELQHRITDEIQLRMMQRAGENLCVCCGQAVPEGRQVCPICEKGINGGG